jgi:Leucine-rich repeat (LRR) protein
MSFLISILFFFTTTSDTIDYQNSVEGDRRALMDLYEATDGSSWSNDSGWGSGNPDDYWYGIKVNSEGRVSRVDLSDNNLAGSLPESIGNLTQVRYFNVKGNRLRGSIPSSIGNMTSLRSLYLNGRPGDFSIQEPKHPGKAPGGTGADKRTNNFSGQLPESIGALRNLEWLELNGTGKIGEGLEGAIPESFGNLRNLKGLLLDHNRLEQFPKSLGNLRNLVHLALGHQGRDVEGDYHLLEGHGFPQWIGKLKKLKYLWMSDNEGVGGQLPNMSGLYDLEIFMVSRNKLTGQIPSYFTDGTMPKINMIGFAWNNFSGPLPEVREPNNLKMFTADGNNLTGHIPDSWGSDAARRMINFSLGWNELEGQIPNLSHMHQLRYFRGNNNNFIGPVPMVDSLNKKLNFLHFQNNNLSGRVPPELANIADLPRIGKEDLNISNNNFSKNDIQPLIDAFAKVGKLEVLKY